MNLLWVLNLFWKKSISYSYHHCLNKDGKDGGFIQPKEKVLLLNLGMVEHSGLITKLNTSRCFHYWEVWFSWTCPRVPGQQSRSTVSVCWRGEFLLLKSNVKVSVLWETVGGTERNVTAGGKLSKGNWCFRQTQERHFGVTGKEGSVRKRIRMVTSQWSQDFTLHTERLFSLHKRKGLSVKSLDNSSSILKWKSCLGTPWPNIELPASLVSQFLHQITQRFQSRQVTPGSIKSNLRPIFFTFLSFLGCQDGAGFWVFSLATIFHNSPPISPTCFPLYPQVLHWGKRIKTMKGRSWVTTVISVSEVFFFFSFCVLSPSRLGWCLAKSTCQNKRRVSHLTILSPR